MSFEVRAETYSPNRGCTVVTVAVSTPVLQTMLELLVGCRGGPLYVQGFDAAVGLFVVGLEPAALKTLAAGAERLPSPLAQAQVRRLAAV